MYADQNHVTSEYSGRLAPVFGALTNRALATG
jgi:hypothetical protein